MTQALLSVMRRKAGADRPPPEFGHMTSEKALRMALSKATQDVLGVPLTLGDIATVRLSVPAIVQTLPEAALTVVINRKDGTSGVLCLDRMALACILEAQTTGRITPRDVPNRRPTATDAMMAKRFNTVLLNSFSMYLEGQLSSAWAAGFEPAAQVGELRRLPHVLEDVAFNGFQVDVTFGAEGRSGKIYLFVPEPVNGIAAARLEPEEVFTDPWEGALQTRVMDSQALVDVVLHRFELPLSRVAALAPGDQLIFPARKLSEMSLEGADGARIGSCRLGASDGMRAICVGATTGQAEDGEPAEPEHLHVGNPQTEPQAPATAALAGDHDEAVLETSHTAGTLDAQGAASAAPAKDQA